MKIPLWVIDIKMKSFTQRLCPRKQADSRSVEVQIPRRSLGAIGSGTRFFPSQYLAAYRLTGRLGELLSSVPYSAVKRWPRSIWDIKSPDAGDGSMHVYVHIQYSQDLIYLQYWKATTWYSPPFSVGFHACHGRHWCNEMRDMFSCSLQ